MVLVDREAPSRVRASSVLTDHQTGMRNAVESLIDLGHRRIALVSGASDVRPSRERLAGLEATMRSRGLGSPIVVPGQLTEAHGEAATEQLLTMNDAPTAIVMGSNQLLAGALRAFCSRGIVPGDPVSLVSCDDSPLSELYRPPISVISRDSFEMGRLAAELILDRMVSAGDPRSETVGTTYIARPSCTPPPAAIRAHAAVGRG
jgi:LacI family transcriptional regulator